MENKWISIEEALPKHGDYIEGYSDSGKTWFEYWDCLEPIGNMVAWRYAEEPGE